MGPDVDAEAAAKTAATLTDYGLAGICIVALAAAVVFLVRRVQRMIEVGQEKCDENAAKQDKKIEDLAAAVSKERDKHDALMGGFAMETRASLDAATRAIESNAKANEHNARALTRLVEVLGEKQQEDTAIIPAPAPTKHRSPSRSLVAILAILFMLGGCFRSEAQTATSKEDQITVAGTAEVPGVGSVPVTLRIDRRGTEDATTESKTQIDGKAIGDQIGAAAGQAVRAAIAQAVPALAEMTKASAPAGGLGGLDGGGLLTGAMALGTAYVLNRQKEASRLRSEERTRRAEEERTAAEAKAREYAERLPPPA